MKAKMADIVGGAGLVAITWGAVVAELWAGLVVGGAVLLFVSWRVGGDT